MKVSVLSNGEISVSWLDVIERLFDACEVNGDGRRVWNELPAVVVYGREMLLINWWKQY